MDKGFNILEIASSSGLFPGQGVVVQTAKESLRFVWKRMMAELAPQDAAGNYQRPSYSFSSTSQLNLEDTGKYHLYVGNPCPWCHRALLAVYWHGLEDYVGVTRLEDNPVKASRGGWIFSDSQPDKIFGGCRDLRQLYDKLTPGGSFQGRCTAPLLVNAKKGRIVSNESADIVRLLNAAAMRLDDSDETRNLRPPSLLADIDATNDWVYRLINNGVYRCGFATTQVAYDQASRDVRTGLARANEILSRQPYLCGQRFTEADLRLLPTALRFDGAYAPLFRAGGGHTRIRDYPSIHQWLRRCWQTYPAVSQSIDLADASASYYRQLFPLNPGGLLPSPAVSAELLGLVDH